MTIIAVSSIVEDNGKTIRQNNMEKTHTIPLDTFVEIIPSRWHDYSGMRGYVVRHGRDCDGTPLYSMGPKGDRELTVDDEPDERTRNFCNMMNKAWGAFSEHSLRVLPDPIPDPNTD
jgi:hypothetical protein